SLTSSIDLPETILELAGFTIPDSMQGKSIVPLLKDPQQELNEDVIIEMDDDHNNQKIRTIIFDKWRLSVFREHGELFNLQEDPNEMNNLWDDDKHLRVKTELLLKLTRREISKEKDPVIRDCGF
ncbi:MAG: DUF4976 domain-containing protein, partial [Candidatus Lokiarchaeota archaeon]|nr:DUF4976 domain-containing protein [Candidatus Lokiarchaeota archaeon]